MKLARVPHPTPSEGWVIHTDAKRPPSSVVIPTERSEVEESAVDRNTSPTGAGTQANEGFTTEDDMSSKCVTFLVASTA